MKCISMHVAPPDHFNEKGDGRDVQYMALNSSGGTRNFIVTYVNLNSVVRDIPKCTVPEHNALNTSTNQRLLDIQVIHTYRYILVL